MQRKSWSLAAVLSCCLAWPAFAKPVVDIEATVRAMAHVGACWSPSLSPDGRQLAFVATLSGVPQVWVMQIAGGFPRQVTSFDDPIQAVTWSPDGQYLAFIIFPGGGMNSQVYVVKPDGTGLRRLTDGGQETNLLGPWMPDSRSLALASAQRDPAAMDAYLYDLDSSSMRLVAKNSGLGSFMDVSADGKRAILWRMEQRIDENLYLVDLATGKETLLTPHHPPGSFPTGQFSPDGSIVYLQTNQDRDLIAFGQVRIDSAGRAGPIEVLASRPDAELQEFEITRDGSTAGLIWNVEGRSEFEFLDLQTHKTTPGPRLPTEIAGDLIFTRDGQMAVLVGFGSTAAPDFFTYDRRTSELKQVTFSQHPGVSMASLITPELIRYRSFDGVEISGWLYKPREAPSPGPLVLVAHGGPEEQERPSFLGTYQALLSQGIAIFAPNFRGSSGFGKKFQNLDNRELRVNVVKDIKAGIDYLVSQRIADPKRLGMFGFSYGGYLTLSAISEYPDLFAAAADLSGIVNFETFFAHTEPWMAAISRGEYGDPQTESDLLRLLSPIHKLDLVKTPTLVLHGANDTNVPVIEAEQIVDNLKLRKIPVKYVLFPDEGHGVEKVTNRITYALAIVGWFGKYLLPPPILVTDQTTVRIGPSF
jgi:dipeptidyl aminopeptidase/acylaminoacyl peptidase